MSVPRLTKSLTLNLVIFLVLKRLYLSKVDKYIVEGVTGINREWFLKILSEI